MLFFVPAVFYVLINSAVGRARSWIYIPVGKVLFCKARYEMMGDTKKTCLVIIVRGKKQAITFGFDFWLPSGLQSGDEFIVLDKLNKLSLVDAQTGVKVLIIDDLFGKRNEIFTPPVGDVKPAVV